MPIVIMPKRSKMDKMGGGGMDIGRTTPSPSKYAIPGIEKNPTLKKKKMNKMVGKMEDMREYMDVLDEIDEDPKSTFGGGDISYDQFKKGQPGKPAMGFSRQSLEKEIKDWAEKYNEFEGVNGDKLADGYLRSTLDTGIMKDMYDADEYDAFNKKMGYKDDGDWEQEDYKNFMMSSPNTKGMFDTIAAIQEKYNIDEEGVDAIMDDLKSSNKMEGMRDYLDALDGIEEEMHSEDTVQESYHKDMMQDVEEGMTEEEFNKKYPGSKGEYAKIKKEIADMNESQIDEGGFKQAQIEIQDWAEKYNKYKGTNADDLAHGYLQAMLNTGIMSDAYEENEVEAFNKMKGYEADSNDREWADGDHEDFTENLSGVSPITAGMFSEIGKILGKYGLEDDDVDKALGYFEGVSMENKDVDIEEDCGCEQEAVEQMVTMPMQELADILQLAGYKNYEEKIAEYANEPAEEYMDPEEQLVGLSGGLNRPKKSYPASAPGDNPMDQEPREVEETMETFEKQLYKSYKDFLEEAEIEQSKKTNERMVIPMPKVKDAPKPAPMQKRPKQKPAPAKMPTMKKESEVTERGQRSSRPMPNKPVPARPQRKPMGRPGMKSQMSNMPT